MGRSTESNFSILKVKKSDPNIASKIQSRRVQAKYEDPRTVNPFDKHVLMFFDSAENCKRIFQETKNVIELVQDKIGADKKSRTMTAHSIKKHQQSKTRDDRHSYYDLKQDLPDKYQYNAKF